MSKAFQIPKQKLWRKYLFLSFENQALEKLYQEEELKKANKTDFGISVNSTLFQLSLLTFLTSSLMLWIFGKILFGSPFGRIYIMEIQAIIGFGGSIIGIIHSVATLIVS